MTIQHGDTFADHQSNATDTFGDTASQNGDPGGSDVTGNSITGSEPDRDIADTDDSPRPSSEPSPRPSPRPSSEPSSDDHESPVDRRNTVPFTRRSTAWSFKRAIDYAFLITIAVILASLIRSFVGLAFYIPSESMYPTLKINDRVIVSRISYRIGDPKRGDVVVFRNPGFEDLERPNIIEKVGRVMFEIVGSRQPKDKNYIKRVIGLPGDRLMFKDGSVYVNGAKLAEPWLQPGVITTFQNHEDEDIVVPANHYFMMGDNRPESCDSRCFTAKNGPPAPTFIERSAIVGRAFHRIWPINRFGSL